MTRLTVWIALITMVIGYLVYGFVTIDRRGDADQIGSLINDEAAAIQQRDLSTAMAGISKDYKGDDGMNYDRLRLLTAQALRQETSYTASVDSPRIDVRGENATVVVHAVVKSESGGAMYDRQLTVTLRKERGIHAAVIPVSVWRIVSVKNLGLSLET